LENFNKKDAETSKEYKALELQRENIDEIDRKLISLLIKRIRIVKNIGKIKKLKDLPVNNAQRENEILKTIEKLIIDKDLSKKMKDIYKRIFEISKEIEKEE